CAHESVCGLQKSAVQAMLSSQSRGLPATQPIMMLHVSTPSQLRPSLHAASIGVLLQSLDASSQASTVHAMPSSHGDPELGVQPVPGAPFGGSHFSTPSQNLPSLQAASFAV